MDLAMKYSTVIFDLFGTLVKSLSSQEYEVVLQRMASALSVSHDKFTKLWFDTAHERNIGAIPSIEDNIKYICDRMRVQADDSAIRLAARIRVEFVVEIMQPRSDAIEVLSQLKSQGFKIGLISNCSPDTPLIWRNTPFIPFFDVTIFSSSVGMKKPDPRIYRLATERLSVQPEDCLYVGDGASQELTGAAQVGMSPALIRTSDEDFNDSLPDDAREKWNGLTISSLMDIMAVIEEVVGR